VYISTEYNIISEIFRKNATGRNFKGRLRKAAFDQVSSWAPADPVPGWTTINSQLYQKKEA